LLNNQKLVKKKKKHCFIKKPKIKHQPAETRQLQQSTLLKQFLPYGDVEQQTSSPCPSLFTLFKQPNQRSGPRSLPRAKAAAYPTGAAGGSLFLELHGKIRRAMQEKQF
jgi:hypothetical protein